MLLPLTHCKAGQSQLHPVLGNIVTSRVRHSAAWKLNSLHRCSLACHGNEPARQAVWRKHLLDMSPFGLHFAAAEAAQQGWHWSSCMLLLRMLSWQMQAACSCFRVTAACL